MRSRVASASVTKIHFPIDYNLRFYEIFVGSRAEMRRSNVVHVENN